MVLGDGAREAGAKADEISELTPGVAYVRVEGTRQIARVRASYLTDHDITDLTTAGLTRTSPPDTAVGIPANGAPDLHLIEGSETA